MCTVRVGMMDLVRTLERVIMFLQTEGRIGGSAPANPVGEWAVARYFPAIEDDVVKGSVVRDLAANKIATQKQLRAFGHRFARDIDTCDEKSMPSVEFRLDRVSAGKRVREDVFTSLFTEGSGLGPRCKEAKFIEFVDVTLAAGVVEVGSKRRVTHVLTEEAAGFNTRRVLKIMQVRIRQEGSCQFTGQRPFNEASSTLMCNLLDHFPSGMWDYLETTFGELCLVLGSYKLAKTTLSLQFNKASPGNEILYTPAYWLGLIRLFFSKAAHVVDIVKTRGFTAQETAIKRSNHSWNIDTVWLFQLNDDPSDEYLSYAWVFGNISNRGAEPRFSVVREHTSNPAFVRTETSRAFPADMGDISDNDMGGEVGAALAGALDPRIMTNLIMKPGPPTCVFTMTKPDGVMIRHLRCEIPRMFIGHAQIMITQFPTTGTLEGKWKMDAKMFVFYMRHVFPVDDGMLLRNRAAHEFLKDVADRYVPAFGMGPSDVPGETYFTMTDANVLYFSILCVDPQDTFHVTHYPTGYGNPGQPVPPEDVFAYFDTILPCK